MMGKYLDSNGLSFLWSKFCGIFAVKSTTLTGYGIKDAYIKNGVVTLGNNSIEPVVKDDLENIDTRVSYLEGLHIEGQTVTDEAINVVTTLVTQSPDSLNTLKEVNQWILSEENSENVISLFIDIALLKSEVASLKQELADLKNEVVK